MRSRLLALSCVLLLIVALGSVRAASPGGPTAARDTVVAQFADTTITLAELDSAFVASAGGPEAISDSTLSDYRAFLTPYLHYRLKVRAARDAALDTLPRIRRDVHAYRQQLARPAVMRTEVYEPVTRTLYERRAQAVVASHILLRPASVPGPDSARSALRALADSAEQGVPFGDLAYRHSDAPSARKQGARGYRGRLGPLRAGQVVLPFEKRMYSLEPGTVSAPFRTQYGYHLLKVHERRPAPPPIELSHILRRPQRNAAQPRAFLDSLRAHIVRGATTFAEAATEHSQDPRSAPDGGALGTVSPHQLPEALRTAVARLDTVGAVSEVVRTRFGYHLLKLTDRQQRPSFAEAYSSLKDEVAGTPRAQQRKAAFAREVRSDYGVTVDTTRLLNETGLAALDSLARPLLSRSPAPTPIATLGDSTYTLSQLSRHLTPADGGTQLTLGALLDAFLNEKARQYAVTQHAQTSDSLRRQLRTYREGTLLFRYMQDSVWTAAVRDTAGLHDTYRRHRDRYRFPERIRTLVLRAPADSLLQPLRRAHENGRTLSATVQAAAPDSLVDVDTVFVTDQSPAVYQPIRSAPDGAAVGPVAQGSQSLLLLRDTRLSPRRKRFAEARSAVLQDHQARIERRTMQQLRTRYDADTFPARIRRLPPVPSTTP